MKLNKMVNCGFKFLSDSNYRFLLGATYGKYNSLDDETYLKRVFKAKFGYTLDIKNPKSFNEKLQWLKLNDRNPSYTMMVDKYAVKQYVAGLIGEEYIIPTLGVWERPEDIRWDKLPNQFVLKVTHDSGGLVICKDKVSLDKKSSEKKLRKSLQRNYYLQHREWPYKDVPRKIIAEKFMTDDDSVDLTDYKFLCFNGKVKCIFTGTDRFSKNGIKITFYDLDWNIMPFKRCYPARKTPVKKPESFQEMIKLAEILAEGIPFVRIDFYEIHGRPYFGEITFFPASGLEAFEPIEWDYILGSWIELPTEK